MKTTAFFLIALSITTVGCKKFEYDDERESKTVKNRLYGNWYGSGMLGSPYNYPPNSSSICYSFRGHHKLVIIDPPLNTTKELTWHLSTLRNCINVVDQNDQKVKYYIYKLSSDTFAFGLKKDVSLDNIFLFVKQ